MQSGLSAQSSTILNTDEVPPSAVDAEPEEGSDVYQDANEEGDFEVQRMITECFGRFENDIGDREEDEVLEDEGEFMADEGMDLLEESSIPLYEGSKTSRVVAIILLVNCFAVFGVSNACATELLKLLSELLPVKNTLPKSYYKARKYLRQLGLSFVSIHACVNGCCLFRKELEGAINCPKCGQLRFKSESSRTPMKVLRHFPLIPRLRRMYRCTSLAKLNKWHTERKDRCGNVECVPDSKAWKHIDSVYPGFALEERNIRLGLALDGVNPFSNQSLSHSTWPVVLLNYNLPPWLVTKRFFLMLALLIPGKESVTSENVDVYLAPLIEELKQLWEGIEAVDASAERVNRKFTLKAILMWCIHDFPAYGLVSGQVTKGYKGYTECGLSVTTRRSTALTKNVYLGHRRLLNRTHPYRRLQRVFDGSQETRPPPRHLSGRDVVRYAKRKETWLADSPRNRPGGVNDPVHDTGVKRLSILFSLPYWHVSV
jgi:hypothetical protein